MKNNRRDFMKLLAKSSTVGALGSVSQLALMENAVAASPNFSDYKALVCVFLFGGNDSFNMLIPSDASYDDYKAIRAALAVKKNDLGSAALSNAIINGTMGKGARNPYNVDLKRETAYTKGYYDLSSKGINLGVNAVMPEFAQLILDDKLSIVANAGNMVAPVTRDQVLNKTANLPLFLFAHNHQQRSLQTGQANNLNDIGWAGKIADAWTGINNNSPFGLNISYSGNRRMMIGNNTGPLILGYGKPRTFSYMDDSTSQYNQDRRKIFNSLISLGKNSNNAFEKLAAGIQGGTLESFDTLISAWDENDIQYDRKGPYGEDLFAIPSSEDVGFDTPLYSNVFKSFETVAKMVDLGANDKFKSNGYNRQIFMIGIGGFDTHDNQATRHSRLLRSLSLGLWKFQNALEERGLADKVTTFSMSDFGRTLSINGGNGTDHAWGSHHFVMGGAGSNISGTLNGGQLIGELPELKAGGANDYYNKGRIIPSVSQDQINASICDWFGVDESLVAKIFPNLSNFKKSNSIKSAYLDNLFI